MAVFVAGFFVVKLILPFDVIKELEHDQNTSTPAPTPPGSQLFHFPRDMDPVPAEVNRLNNQVLVHCYEAEWRKWN